MPAKTWFKITAKANNTIEVDILDEIGAFGISTEIFLSQLRSAKERGIKNLHLNIDSPGGACDDGLSIYDLARQFDGKVTAHVIGTAASMASIILLAADHRTVSENGRVMIHRPTGGVRGNPDDLQAGTDVVKQFEQRLIAIYVERTGQSEQTIRDAMKAQLGTWYFGEQAVAAGFAHKVNQSAKAKAFKAEWACLFTALPAALFDTTAKSEPPPRNEPDTIMTAAQKTRFRALLALAKRTSEEDTELATLQALATKEGYDDAAIKADNDADTITALNARLATLETQAKAAQDDADKLAKEKADAEAKAKDPAALLERLNKLENLVKSGVINHAGGTKPIEGLKEGGEDEAPKNEAELRAAMAKAKTFDEKRKLKNAFEARNK